MRSELVTIETDNWPMEGAWYLPDGEVKGAVLLLHGNVTNFTVGAPRFLPPVLTAMGLACLAFNRRGHDILVTHNGREPTGGAFQTIGESLADNEFAARWLGERGHPAPIVIGHSNGGMLAVPHVAGYPETPALVLLSAHKGGAGFLEFASRAGLFAQDRYDEIQAQAQRLVAEGRGAELMLMPGWYYCISAASFLDLAANMPGMFDHAPKVSCPALFVRGSEEPAEIYPAERFAELSGGPCDVEIIANANHFYHGVEADVCDVVARWLKKTLAL